MSRIQSCSLSWCFWVALALWYSMTRFMNLWERGLARVRKDPAFSSKLVCG